MYPPKEVVELRGGNDLYGPVLLVILVVCLWFTDDDSKVDNSLTSMSSQTSAVLQIGHPSDELREELACRPQKLGHHQFH